MSVILFFLFFSFLHIRVRVPYNPYGVPPQYADPYQRRPQQGVGREEVLIVSDDRVLSLQPRGLVGRSQSQRHMADNVSMVSIPRC